MGILTYNIISTSNNSAIYKFVVIRVLFNKPKMKPGIKKTCKRTVGYRVNNVMCYSRISHPLYDFFVFIKYLIAYAKQVFPFSKSLPC